MIRPGIALATTLATLALGVTTAWAQAPPACGAKLEGAGQAISFTLPLTEDDRNALAAGIYLALKDESDRGTWPVSEIEISRPCPLAEFTADGSIWTVHGGEGLAPPRWIHAKNREELLFLASGPAPAAATDWMNARDITPTTGGPGAYYLAAVLSGEIYVFGIYDDAPSPKQLADDAFEALSGKSPPLAVFDSQAHAVSLFLNTASRRTSVLFKPELISGERHAIFYGPDGRYFTPVAGEGVLLRGSDLSCDAGYGGFERTRLSVNDTRDESLDLGCGYQLGENILTLFVTRSPSERIDRRIFEAYVREEQRLAGVSAKRPGIRTGPRETFAVGKAWMDKDGVGQGLWLTRRGDYVIEVRLTFNSEDEPKAIQAVQAFGATLEASSEQ